MGRTSLDITPLRPPRSFSVYVWSRRSPNFEKYVVWAGPRLSSVHREWLSNCFTLGVRGPSTSCLKFPLRDVNPKKNLYWEDEGQRFVFHYFFKLTRVIDSTYLGPWSPRPVSLKGTQGAYCSSGRICCENGWSPCITISHDALEKTNG